MSATNHTTNYNLSQFIGTDKPAWLTDYNGDMSAIDTAIKAAKDAGDNAQTNVSNLDAQINTPSTGLAAVVSGLDAQINTPGTGLAADLSNLAAKVGTGSFNTVAQTAVGAINELVASGFSKFDIQSVTYTGVAGDTYATAMNALHAALQTLLTSLGTKRVEIFSLYLADIGILRALSDGIVDQVAPANNILGNTYSFMGINFLSGSLSNRAASLASSTSQVMVDTSDKGSDSANGKNFSITMKIYD